MRSGQIEQRRIVGQLLHNKISPLSTLYTMIVDRTVIALGMPALQSRLRALAMQWLAFLTQHVILGLFKVSVKKEVFHNLICQWTANLIRIV
jgi:hypothetical protein